MSELVRANLGQVMKLRDLGYMVYGPINGPNDGWPEYQVPRAWLDRLSPEIMTSDPLDPGPSSNLGRPYPRPRPIHKPRDLESDNSATANPGIDPLLLMEEHAEALVSTETSNALAITSREPSPTPGPILDHSQLLGKRSQVGRSPQKQRSSQKNTRRKVVRDDDLAIQEARQLLNCTARTRPRTRSGRKRG